jgi:hypothetical protein
LIERGGSRIQITEAILLAAVKACWGCKLEIFLNCKGDETEITEVIFVAAAAAAGTFSEENALKTILGRKGDNLRITEAVLLAAAGSPGDQMKMLLDYNGDQTDITEALLVAAAGNTYGNTMPLRYLLDEISTPATLIATTRNMLRFFERKNKHSISRHKNKEVTVTEAVFLAAAANINNGDRFMYMLLGHQKRYNVTEALLLVAVRNQVLGPRILETLVSREGIEVEFSAGVVTQRVLEVALASEYHASGFLPPLVRRVDHGIALESVFDAVMAGKKGKDSKNQLSRQLCDPIDEPS